MSSQLVKRIQKGRELRVPIDKFTFIARRPTDLEAVEIYRKFEAAGADQSAVLAEAARVAADYVAGWESVTEDDVMGGGGTDAMAFDKDLWREWCADRREFWMTIANAVLNAYETHYTAMEEAKKKSQPG